MAGLVPAIHALMPHRCKDVDARAKPGHDGGERCTMQKTTRNIFADLGLANPEQELLKAQLSLQIYRIIKQRGLTQVQAWAARCW
jgi:Helix-turn-helix domain